jgi:hypothetical protein
MEMESLADGAPTQTRPHGEFRAFVPYLIILHWGSVRRLELPTEGIPRSCAGGCSRALTQMSHVLSFPPI